ncbi:chromate resistance protein [Candidatus Roizmanbacteria bacterium]|nr:chromate resistance protein [Candidatus Roizmanbacteria bacterium]
MKTIVTHIHPDLDAITSIWLIKRFLPDWQDADIAFVSAGATYKNLPPDGDPDIIHVDTGLGKFDHHQTDEFTSATKRVFTYLGDKHSITDPSIEALEHIVQQVTEIDHFAEANYPEPTHDRYDFMLTQLIEGLHNLMKDNTSVVNYVLTLLDALLILFENKTKAEHEIKTGFVFESKWGKTLAIETKNEEVMKLALKIGYGMVIRKDPEKGNIRIKTLPKKEMDITPIYKIMQKLDPQATWFLHASKNILLNGSSKGPTMIPSVLPLKKVIEIVRGI